jgi:hypothetical protein
MSEESDGHEIDALDELTRSEGYELLVERIAEVLLQQRSELESRAMAKTPDDANYIRGMIAGLKLSLDLPQMMTVEIQSDIKHKR